MTSELDDDENYPEWMKLGFYYFKCYLEWMKKLYFFALLLIIKLLAARFFLLFIIWFQNSENNIVLYTNYILVYFMFSVMFVLRCLIIY